LVVRGRKGEEKRRLEGRRYAKGGWRREKGEGRDAKLAQ